MNRCRQPHCRITLRRCSPQPIDHIASCTSYRDDALPLQPDLCCHMGNCCIPHSHRDLPFDNESAGQRFRYHWLGNWGWMDSARQPDHVPTSGVQDIFPVCWSQPDLDAHRLLFYPETSDRSLESIDAMFSTKSPLHSAMEKAYGDAGNGDILAHRRLSVANQAAVEKDVDSVGRPSDGNSSNHVERP